jgi:CBS domain-containing protein
VAFGPRQFAEDVARVEGGTVGEVMSREVITVGEDASLEEAVTLMERHGVKRLPVVKGKALIGILTRANLVHAFIVGLTTRDRSGADSR